MKILDLPPNRMDTVVCHNCGAKLQYSGEDLRWTHTECEYYYVVCPCCHSNIFIKGNEILDRLYHMNYEKTSN